VKIGKKKKLQAKILAARNNFFALGKSTLELFKIFIIGISLPENGSFHFHWYNPLLKCTDIIWIINPL
jgi:hypothetical protein